MRLAAIFIPAKTLPYIFGKDHLGQTLNLGGKYLYEIEEQDEILLIKDRDANEDFISGFWGKNVSLVSAIVGSNGTGKTTILRAINQESDLKHQNVLHIFEKENDDSKVYILNETSKIVTPNSTLELEDLPKRSLEKQYYSPVLDFELQDTRSAISLVNYVQGTMEEHYFDSITRNILFLNEPVLDEIKKVYQDFPSYDKYLIRIVQHTKSYFRKPYIDTNMGNPNKGEVIINNIDGDLVSLESDKPEKEWGNDRFISTLRKYKEILQGDNFTAVFQRLWALEEYSSNNQYDYIHDGNNFLKNLEVTLLSYLILGAVFPQTGLHGGYDFTNILEEIDFNKRLDKFLELYLANTYYELYEDLKENANGISIQNESGLLKFINEYRWDTRLGVKTDRLKESMKKDVEGFSKIKEFYDFIKILIEKKTLFQENGSLVFDITKDDLSIYTEMVDKYKILLEGFKQLPITPSLIQFVPNKKLSSGEKSLIDFYASINNYIDRFRNARHQCHENYLLLLDEPELGYHPLWKKKFVNAITTTLPILFSKITPTIYNETSNEYIDSQMNSPNLQIIFSTHDPLTLSDIPNQNIIYLGKNTSMETILVENHERKSFGANITDLLADSFFVEDGLVGDFAKRKIKETIEWLKNKKRNIQEKQYFKNLIMLVDEPIIQRKLSEMYDEIFEEDLEVQTIDEQMEHLAKLRSKLKRD